MENLKKIADELRVQIQDEWTMGSPRTSSATYKELQPYNPQSLAGSYVATYADYICNQNSLFWRTINTKIATILGYYNEANDYLKRESYRVSTRHVAQCLRHTSLAYIMNLIYCGLLQNSITPKHIQQVQGIPSDEKGIGLQIAGIDVEEYNELLKSITSTRTSTSTKADTEILNIPEAKILLDRLVESEILNSDYSLGTTHLSTAAAIADAISRTCNISKKNVLFSSLWNVSAEQLRDGLQSAKRAVDKSKYREVLSHMFVKVNSFGSYQTDHVKVDEMMKSI